MNRNLAALVRRRAEKSGAFLVKKGKIAINIGCVAEKEAKGLKSAAKTYFLWRTFLPRLRGIRQSEPRNGPLQSIYMCSEAILA
jgi:hypothetical protein